MGYTLGLKELDGSVQVKPGANIMLLGPPMSGKDVILKSIVLNGLMSDAAAVIVSTHEPGNNVLRWFEELNVPTENLGVVDCITRTLGVGASETENIKIASSPVDLTGIGVKISQFFETFWMKKQIRNTYLCIDSISTILMYSNLQTVFRFLHVFTGRVKVAGALGLYVVDEGMHEPQSIATLKQLFDGVIEIKVEDDQSFLRAVGLSPKPTPWLSYTLEGNLLKVGGD